MNTKKIHGSTNQTPNEDIQELYNQNQFPDTRHLKPETGNQHPESSTRPFIIPIFIPHAGCPHQCIFCNQVSITGANQKVVDRVQFQNQVLKFLNYKREYRKTVQIAFYGGNFLGLKSEKIKALLEQAADFVNQGHVDSIRFSTRPDTIDKRRLDILNNFPVSTIELGVQSMDDKVLKLAGRGHRVSDTIRAVDLLKQQHFTIGLQMMVGLPGDDEIRSLATARKIADLRPDFVRIYPTVVVEKSRLADWYKNGDYTPLTLAEGVMLVKRIYLLFGKKNIEVIRMGLQASEDLEEGSTVLAGPYHPAFGHMVYSAIFYDAAKAAIESAGIRKDTLTILVNPRSISKMRGLNNSNIKKLKNQFQFESVEVVSDASLTDEEVRIG